MKKTSDRMEHDPKDQKVVDLLTKLKNANGGYPSEMLESRRQTYLNHMAGLGLGAGLGAAFKNAAKKGGGSGFSPPTAGTLLEVALVVAIVAEAGTLAYFYRDKVADFFQSFAATSNTQEVASPPVLTSPFPELEISGVPVSAVPTGTTAEMPASTPVPGLTDDLTVNNSGGANLTSSTPIPNGNNGNHYGQTPKPERTKDKNNNKPPNDNPGNGINDKPPKSEKEK